MHILNNLNLHCFMLHCVCTAQNDNTISMKNLFPFVAVDFYEKRPIFFLICIKMYHFLVDERIQILL